MINRAHVFAWLLAGCLCTVLSPQGKAGQAPEPVLINAFASGDRYYLDPASVSEESDGILLYQIFNDEAPGTHQVGRLVTLNRINCKTGQYQSYLESWHTDPTGGPGKHNAFSPRLRTLTRNTLLYNALRQTCQVHMAEQPLSW